MVTVVLDRAEARKTVTASTPRRSQTTLRADLASAHEAVVLGRQRRPAAGHHHEAVALERLDRLRVTPGEPGRDARRSVRARRCRNEPSNGDCFRSGSYRRPRDGQSRRAGRRRSAGRGRGRRSRRGRRAPARAAVEVDARPLLHPRARSCRPAARPRRTRSSGSRRPCTARRRAARSDRPASRARRRRRAARCRLTARRL